MKKQSAIFIAYQSANVARPNKRKITQSLSYVCVQAYVLYILSYTIPPLTLPLPQDHPVIKDTD